MEPFLHGQQAALLAQRSELIQPFFQCGKTGETAQLGEDGFGPQRIGERRAALEALAEEGSDMAVIKLEQLCCEVGIRVLDGRAGFRLGRGAG